jgi:predicted dehydrogenase
LKHRVLIVGCGQLGSRHLQAVASLSEIEAIDVFDPSPAGLALGRERLGELKFPHLADVRWLTRLEDATPEGALCIVATRADVRCSLVQDVADRLGYRTFLLEKIVARSVAEYEQLVGYSREKKLNVWVNCKTRAHWSHQRIKSRLMPGVPVVVTAQGGNHGLANNGVHAADLFAFYSDARTIECISADIDPIVHSTKRGADVLDLSGTICARSDNGSQFILSYAKESGGPGYFTVTSSDYRAVVDDSTKGFFESSASDSWAWHTVPYNADLAVSFMTKEFATDILSKGSCRLPTLEQCFPGHKLILGTLLPAFNRLTGVSRDYCPVT